VIFCWKMPLLVPASRSPPPALVAAPLDQGGLPDRQALHQQIQVGARYAGQGWVGQLLMTA
jgi:hypothetical protein